MLILKKKTENFKSSFYAFYRLIYSKFQNSVFKITKILNILKRKDRFSNKKTHLIYNKQTNI